MILTTFIAAALVLVSPTSTVPAEHAVGLAPLSLIDSDGDSDSDRQRGRGRGRGRGSDSDSDHDSDSDSDGRNGRNGNCIDINGDGRCDFGTSSRSRRDDRRRDDCDFRDRRGRCDFVDNRRGNSMPDMIGAILRGRGQRSSADRWLTRDVRDVRWLDRDRNGVPERATFLNTAGRVAQVWIDNNRDGRADRVQYYQGGRLVRVASR